MLTSFGGINISSLDPKRLVLFYHEKMGVPLLEEDPHYDGCQLGFLPDGPVICIWDEAKWGKANQGPVTFFFGCDDLDKTYRQLREKGVELDPPKTAVWGGKEMPVLDPDGNTLLLL